MLRSPLCSGRGAAATLHPHLARAPGPARRGTRQSSPASACRTAAAACSGSAPRRSCRSAASAPAPSWPTMPSATKPLKRLLPRDRSPVPDGDHIDGHKADIAPVPGHAWLRIAEPDPELHGTPPRAGIVAPLAFVLAAALGRRSLRRRCPRGRRPRRRDRPRWCRRRRNRRRHGSRRCLLRHLGHLGRRAPRWRSTKSRPVITGRRPFGSSPGRASG